MGTPLAECWRRSCDTGWGDVRRKNMGMGSWFLSSVVLRLVGLLYRLPYPSSFQTETDSNIVITNCASIVLVQPCFLQPYKGTTPGCYIWWTKPNILQAIKRPLMYRKIAGWFTFLKASVGVEKSRLTKTGVLWGGAVREPVFLLPLELASELCMWWEVLAWRSRQASLSLCQHTPLFAHQSMGKP